MPLCMTIQYTLSNEGKQLAQWTVENRRTPPAKKMVLMPREIMEHHKIKDYFRRTIVRSSNESANGYEVKLEAVRMP
jgi:hypothetical protein